MPDSLSSAYTSAATLPHHHQYAGSLYSSSHQLTAANNLAAAAASIVNGKQVEGKYPVALCGVVVRRVL